MKDKIINALRGFSDTPELDARFFIEEYPHANAAQTDDFITRRRAGEPVAKILGHIGFWKYDFLTTADTLDPRPDSETMIESLLNVYRDKNAPLRILDVGTGTGCLLLSLLMEYPHAVGVGIDISEKALSVAQKNAQKYGLDRVRFERQDMRFLNLNQKFDLIISNPPYIPTQEVAHLPPSTLFDPVSALDGGSDGLDFYRVLAQQSVQFLMPNGVVAFEIGQGQQNDVVQIMNQHRFSLLQSVQDLGGITRILLFHLA